jgi:hypothetical protein
MLTDGAPIFGGVLIDTACLPGASREHWFGRRAVEAGSFSKELVPPGADRDKSRLRPGNETLNQVHQVIFFQTREAR